MSETKVPPVVCLACGSERVTVNAVPLPERAATGRSPASTAEHRKTTTGSTTTKKAAANGRRTLYQIEKERMCRGNRKPTLDERDLWER